MKVYLRDRITAGIGAGVLLVLVASSYYYSIRTEIDANQAFIDRDAPDFIAHNISVTEFTKDGSADRRVFAEYAEHCDAVGRQAPGARYRRYRAEHGRRRNLHLQRERACYACRRHQLASDALQHPLRDGLP